MLDFKKALNTRIGMFLFTERKLAGLSLADIQERFQIAPMVLKRWECGFASPKGMDFIRLVRGYGPGAYSRAEYFWADIQLEAFGSFRARRSTIADKSSEASPVLVVKSFLTP